MYPSHTPDFLTVHCCWHGIGDLKTMARRKILQEGRKVLRAEMLAKHFLYGLLDQLLDDLPFFPLFYRFELNLATGRGDDRRQITDTWHHFILTQQNRPA